MGIADLADREALASPYARHVNPQWIRVLELLGMNEEYARCEGAVLSTRDGRRILDFLSGYCVHNVGHNHPRVVGAIKDELDRHGPAMLQSHAPELAGELAARLCARAGGRLAKVFFCSSGSEGIEAVIKFARAHTRREGILCATGAFHGLTCGALSLMSNPFWRDGFGPLLPHTASVPFGSVEALEAQLATKRVAAFVVEPIQAESGIRVPEASYLQSAEALCRRYRTLFVLDEVQTGLHRTGPFLAAHRFGLEPDMVVLAKALSGGLVPSGAVLLTDAIYHSVFSSLSRAFVHTSTYSENGLAVRAGLATLDVLEDERLGERAHQAGQHLRDRLRQRLGSYEMVQEVRGAGLLCGVEFQAPRSLARRLSFEAFTKIHPGMFGQMLVMRLFRDENILTQICGNDFLVLKVAPPLIVTSGQIEEFVEALGVVVERMHSSTAFWNEALVLGRRAIGV
ncbi:MAG TPA: aspartate aminotransferase family protein [Candidatus Bathyarchaeia archaeon]|nr:aspartate aminotransferase family protein [Candidatus Bathyarchaeia archaeon]